MMNFKYNSSCTVDERIDLVSKEIINEYPNISLDDAKKIALLDNPIDDRLTVDDKFMRYYFILFIIKKEHPEYKNVLNDLINNASRDFINPVLNSVMYEIEKYSSGQRSDFPIISEFYN